MSEHYELYLDAQVVDELQYGLRLIPGVDQHGQLALALRLDLLEAAAKRAAPAVKEKLAKHEAAQAGGAEVPGGRQKSGCAFGAHGLGGVDVRRAVGGVECR